MKGPMHGIRILDLSAIVSGPMATMVLADQGADVIKVEPPRLGDLARYVGPGKGRISALFAGCNRNKRSVVIDLQAPTGIELLKELAARVDVFVENFRPGVVARLGIDHAALARINPNLVYVSISGFGTDGPYADQRVYDPIIQAVSGLAASQASAASGGEPQLVGSLVCDKVAALTAAQAITAALFARDRGAGGQHVELSMLDAALVFNWPDVMWNHTFLSGDIPAAPTVADIYRIFRTTDGHVAAITLSDDEFRGFCRALELTDLLEDGRFATIAGRVGNIGELLAKWQVRMASLSTKVAMARLRHENVPAAIVNSQRDVVDDPQVRHNKCVVETTHPLAGPMLQARAAARFAASPADLDRHAPDLGEHTRDVLAEFGIAADRIDELFGAGVVA